MPLQWRNQLRQSLEDLGRMPESEAWRVVLLSRADVADGAASHHLATRVFRLPSSGHNGANGKSIERPLLLHPV